MGSCSARACLSDSFKTPSAAGFTVGIMRIHAPLIAALPLLASLAAPGCASSPSIEARIAPAPCKLPEIPGASAERACYALTVAESRSLPETSEIALYVEVWTPPDPARAELAPLIYLTGGPGISLQGYEPLGLRARLLETVDRPIWLLEQRGNLLSDPALCPDLVNEPSLAELEACGAKLGAAGINPTAYNTHESAADIAELARLLERDKIVVWGHSYGTRLAQHLAAQEPALIEAMILEGYIPPNGRTAIEEQELVEVYGRFSTWFATRCAEDPSCSARYPEGAALLEDVLTMSSAVEGGLSLSIPLAEGIALDEASLALWTGAGLATLGGMMLFGELAHALIQTSAEDDAALREFFARLGRGDEELGRAQVAVV